LRRFVKQSDAKFEVLLKAVQKIETNVVGMNERHTATRERVVRSEAIADDLRRRHDATVGNIHAIDSRVAAIKAKVEAITSPRTPPPPPTTNQGA
jgi:predicted RNase H-like nuclease